MTKKAIEAQETAALRRQNEDPETEATDHTDPIEYLDGELSSEEEREDSITEPTHTEEEGTSKIDTPQVLDFAALINQIREMRAEQQTQNKEMRTELQTQNKEMRTEQETQNKKIAEQLLTQIKELNDKSSQDLRADLQQMNRQVQEKVAEEFEKIRTETRREHQTLKEQMEENLNGIHSELEETQRQTEKNIQTTETRLRNDIQIGKLQTTQQINALTETTQQFETTTKTWMKDHNEKLQDCRQTIDELQNNLGEQHDRIQRLEVNPTRNNILNQIPEIHVTCVGNGNTNDPNIPQFTGRAYNPREFLNKLNKFYRRQANRRGRTTDNETELLHETIEASLEQHASRWWQLSKDDVKTWDDFEKIFTDKYWNRDVQKVIKQKIENERYRPGGRLTRAEYFIERVITLNSMTPHISDEEIITTLSEHFGNIIQDATRVQNITTIRGFETLLNREDLQNSKRDARENRTTNNRTSDRPENRRQDQDTPWKRRDDYPFQRPREGYGTYNPKIPPRTYDSTPKNNHYGTQQRNAFQNTRHATNNFHNNFYHQQNRNPPPRRYLNEQHQNKPYPTNEQKKICHMIAEQEEIDPGTRDSKNTTQLPSENL